MIQSETSRYISIFEAWLSWGFSHWDAANFAGIEFEENLNQ